MRSKDSFAIGLLAGVPLLVTGALLHERRIARAATVIDRRHVAPGAA